MVVPLRPGGGVKGRPLRKRVPTAIKLDGGDICLNAIWYLVKSEFSSVRYCKEAYTIVTLYKVLEQHGHVYLVWLYVRSDSTIDPRGPDHLTKLTWYLCMYSFIFIFNNSARINLYAASSWKDTFCRCSYHHKLTDVYDIHIRSLFNFQ